tara:strand:- start:30 stop:260 length:231 start_codon:yes stop_codon:yes gene_type:complete
LQRYERHEAAKLSKVMHNLAQISHNLIFLTSLQLKRGLEDSKSCTKGDGGLLKLPKNNNIQDYSIEIKWNENGTEQ